MWEGGVKEEVRALPFGRGERPAVLDQLAFRLNQLDLNPVGCAESRCPAPSALSAIAGSLPAGGGEPSRFGESRAD